MVSILSLPFSLCAHARCKCTDRIYEEYIRGDDGAFIKVLTRTCPRVKCVSVYAEKRGGPFALFIPGIARSYQSNIAFKDAASRKGPMTSGFFYITRTILSPHLRYLIRIKRRAKSERVNVIRSFSRVSPGAAVPDTCDARNSRLAASALLTK